MKKIIITIILSVILTFTGAFFLFKYLTNNDNNVIEVPLTSAIMNEKRKLLIHLPESYAYNITKKYPILFVFDGSSQDNHLAYHNTILSSIGMNAEFITVGIPNTRGNRSRDLTPGDMKIDIDDIHSKKGNGTTFLDCIEKEIIPFMEKNYRVNEHKMLAGNSRGGLLVMHAFLEKQTVFDAYFCFSPAFWREDHKIVQRFKAHNEKNTTPKFLFMSLGSDENEKMKNGFFKMKATLENKDMKNLIWKSHITPHAVHSNNAYKSSPQALKEWGIYYHNNYGRNQ